MIPRLLSRCIAFVALVTFLLTLMRLNPINVTRNPVYERNKIIPTPNTRSGNEATMKYRNVFLDDQHKSTAARTSRANSGMAGTLKLNFILICQLVLLKILYILSKARRRMISVLTVDQQRIPFFFWQTIVESVSITKAFIFIPWETTRTNVATLCTGKTLSIRQIWSRFHSLHSPATMSQRKFCRLVSLELLGPFRSMSTPMILVAFVNGKRLRRTKFGSVLRWSLRKCITVNLIGFFIGSEPTDKVQTFLSLTGDLKK